MKLDALDHPKTFDFAARLEVALPTALGHLELLWAFAGKQASQGNVGKWPDGAIARACYWMGDPAVFIRALHESGFIDADPMHRYVVHDWHVHAPGWVRAKLKKIGLPFLGRALERSSDTSLEPSIQEKCNEEKGSEVSIDAHTRLAELRSIYPPRSGGNPWDKAEKAINARLSEGHTWDQIIDGTRRYAAFCATTGKVRTEFVMQAARFCGPSKPFLEDWTPPASRADVRLASNLDAAADFMRRTDAATGS